MKRRGRRTWFSGQIEAGEPAMGAEKSYIRKAWEKSQAVLKSIIKGTKNRVQRRKLSNERQRERYAVDLLIFDDKNFREGNLIGVF